MVRRSKCGGNASNEEIINFLKEKNIYNDHIKNLVSRDYFLERINFEYIQKCYNKIIDDSKIIEKNPNFRSSNHFYVTKKMHEKLIYEDDEQSKKIDEIASDFTSIYISNVYYGFMEKEDYGNIYGYICSFYVEQLLPTFKYILYYYDKYINIYKNELSKYNCTGNIKLYIEQDNLLKNSENSENSKNIVNLKNFYAINIFLQYDEIKLLEHDIDELVKIEKENSKSFGKKIYKKIFFEIEKFNHPIFIQHIEYIKTHYEEFLELDDADEIKMNIETLLSYTKMNYGYEILRLNEFVELPVIRRNKKTGEITLIHLGTSRLQFTKDDLKKYYEYNFEKVNFLYDICDTFWKTMKEERKRKKMELQNDYVRLRRNYIDAYRDSIKQDLYEQINLSFLLFVDHIEKYYTLEPYDNYVYKYSTNIEKSYNSMSGGKKYTKTNKKYKDKNNNIKVVYQMNNCYYIKTKVGDKFKYKKIKI